MKQGKFCLECGPSPVSHFLTKINLTVELVANVLTRPLSPLVRFLLKVFGRQGDFLAYYLLSIFSVVGLVRLNSEPSSEKDLGRTKCMWRAAKEMGVLVRELWVFNRPVHIFLAKLPNGRRLVFECLPTLIADWPGLEWIDDKGVMKKKFRQAGFPVPRGGVCWTKFCARETFSKIRRFGVAVVVKPTLGSRSRHTRVNIKSLEDLDNAFRIAKQISPVVSVEEELRGEVYRVVLIGGKPVGILRRDPAFVIGDGRLTIRDLVTNANRDPRRAGSVFHKIPFGAEMDEALEAENFTCDSILPFGKRVVVGLKLGRDQGGINADVTDEVHIENRKLFSDIGKFLRGSLVGIDFIIEDIRKPWRAQMPCGVIELNSMPFLDLHMYPFEGRARDLSKMLWEEVLRGA